MRNTFFTHGTRNEQFLQQGLVEEYLKMFGIDILYIPRKLIQEDGVFNEEIVSEFDDSYLIEAYMENFDGFQGGGDLLTKFGIRQSDELTLVISQQRFEDLISQFIAEDVQVKLGTRPQEGDLIYFPLTNNYFEIKFVEHEEPFYQLGKNYVFKLKCELFEYQDEKGDIFAGDEELVDVGYTLKFYYLKNTGTTATANVIVDGGKVEQVLLTNVGSDYMSPPTVTIDGDGTGATAVAFLATVTITGGTPVKPAVIRANVLNGEIRSVTIVDGGQGYDEDRATLVVSDPVTGGKSATLTPTFKNGELISVTIVSGGSNYKSVRLIDVVTDGSGYTSATALIAPPPSGITGTFKLQERVTGATTGAQAQLVEWNNDEGWIKLKSPTKDFSLGEDIVGDTSGATISLASYNAMQSTDTKYYENVTFEEFADDILDFSETNPFGVIS